jgi:Holliday junction resolvase RusA-like endonuclease
MREDYQNEAKVINSIAIVLPLPPSSNHWNTRDPRTGHTATKKTSRDYRKSVKAMVLHALARTKADVWPLLGPVRVDVDVFFADRRGDLDNRLKFLLDCMAGLLYANDNQIVSISATRQLDKRQPRVRLRVSSTTIDQVPLISCPSPTPLHTPT